jgi:hypothetical protein
MKLVTLFLFLFLGASLFAQGTETQIESVEDHNGWGWKSVVMSNGLVTVATMPDIGARIMQYDLGNHSSIFVNPAMTGKVGTPNQNGSWLNYGGYKVWPAPQSRWSWIPPVILGVGQYSHEIVDQTSDSVSVFVRSEKETWTKHSMLPGLVSERRAVVYKGTSRVKVEQTFVNTTSKAMNWSIWDVTQAKVQHGNEQDYENFWVYFPIKTEGSVFGSTGVKTSASSSAWKGEVAPGIYGVQFRPDGKKIFADSPEGWIAYVDERDGYAYLKLFDIWEGADYPDDGARNEVWVNSSPAYFEVEVVSPIWDIEPNGGKITFVEDWYAAKMFGPVLYANHVGAIGHYVTYEKGTSNLMATYGIFYEGTAKVVFLDAAGAVLAEGQTYDVSPMSEFKIAETLEQPAAAATIEVRVYDKAGTMVGVLESKPVDKLTTVEGKATRPVSFQLENYPNPFNPSTTIEFAVENSQHVRLAIYDMNGRLVDTLVNEFKARGSHKAVWNASEHAAGLYVARLTADGQIATTKMILLK